MRETLFAILILCSVVHAAPPEFEYNKTALSTPGWMTDEVFMPYAVDLTAISDVAISEPSYNGLCFFSTDHSAGTQQVGWAGFDSIEGAWTDYGSAVATGGEAVAGILYDSTNSHMALYYHEGGSTETYGDQSAHLLTSTNFTSWTDQGQLGVNAQHSGYGMAWLNGSTWHLIHALVGGEYSLTGHSTSPTGLPDSWTLQHLIPPRQTHVVGDSYCIRHTNIWQHGSDWYLVDGLRTNPEVGNDTYTSIIAIPINISTMRPTGGYYTLCTTSGITDAANGFRDPPHVFDFNGSTYAVVTGRDASNNQHVLLLKATGTTATQTALQAPVNADGSMERDTLETSLVDWDATASDLDTDEFTKTLIHGSDNSAWSSGNYYELKTGSSGDEDLILVSDDRVSPLAVESILWTLTGVTWTDTALTSTNMYMGIWSGGQTIDTGVRLYFGSGAGSMSPRLIIFNDGVKVLDNVQTDAIGWHCANSEANWCRYNARDFGILIHDYGKKLTVLLDGQPAYYRDLDAGGIDWAGESGVQPIVWLWSAEEHWMRFEGWSVSTFTGQASGGGGGIGFGVGGPILAH